MFFKSNGKEIALVFWFCFWFCPGGLLVQIKGISSLVFFQKDLQNLLQQIIADISQIPYLTDG